MVDDIGVEGAIVLDDLFYDAFLGMKARPIEQRPHYVYVWTYKDGDKQIPFYVGQGTGGRYKDRSNRSRNFKEVVAAHECESHILWPNLTQWAADELEEVTKLVLKKQGNPILDGEHFEPLKSKMALCMRLSGFLG